MTQNTNYFVEWANPLNIHQSGYFRNPNLRSQPRQRFKRSVRACENEDSHSQVSSHFGSGSLSGLPNLQREIAKVKTPYIEELFISSKKY